MELNIYWVKSPCNLENWFVASKTQRKAALYHDYSEGFNPGFSSARKICKISEELIKKYNLTFKSSWPKMSLLEDLNFNIIERRFPRVVSFEKEIFYEGRGIAKLIEEKASESPGVYIINITGTAKYKIGHTTNLSERLRSFRTSNPDTLKLMYFVETEYYRSFENHLHSLFAENRIRGEWFRLEKTQLEILEASCEYVSMTEAFDFKNLKEIFGESRW